MRIGLVNRFRGRPGGDRPAPTWSSIRERAAVAGEVGFDMFVFEDALLYRGTGETGGGTFRASAPGERTTPATPHSGSPRITASPPETSTQTGW